MRHSRPMEEAVKSMILGVEFVEIVRNQRPIPWQYLSMLLKVLLAVSKSNPCVIGVEVSNELVHHAKIRHHISPIGTHG